METSLPMTLRNSSRSDGLHVDHAFRAAFKAAAFERRFAIADAVEPIFDLPDNHALRGPTHSIHYCGYIKGLPPSHPLREELLRRYAKMPNLEQEGLLQFDPAVAKRRLRAELANGAYSILDRSAPMVRSFPDPAIAQSVDYPTLDHRASAIPTNRLHRRL